MKYRCEEKILNIQMREKIPRTAAMNSVFDNHPEYEEMYYKPEIEQERREDNRSGTGNKADNQRVTESVQRQKESATNIYAASMHRIANENKNRQLTYSAIASTSSRQVKTTVNKGNEAESGGNMAQNRKLSIECNKEATTNNIVEETEKVENINKNRTTMNNIEGNKVKTTINIGKGTENVDTTSQTWGTSNALVTKEDTKPTTNGRQRGKDGHRRGKECTV